MLTSGYQFPGSQGLEPGSKKFYPIRNWYPKMYLTAQWVGGPNVILGDSFNGELAQKECWLWQKVHFKPSRAISLPVRPSHMSYHLDLALEIGTCRFATCLRHLQPPKNFHLLPLLPWVTLCILVSMALWLYSGQRLKLKDMHTPSHVRAPSV